MGLSLFVLYLFTETRIHGWDPIAYTARIIDDPILSDTYLSTRYFHPHHLLFIPLYSIVQWVFDALRLAPGDPFQQLQIASNLFGVGCALLGGAIVHRVTGSNRRSLVAASAIGLSNAMWFYSTEVEVMVPTLFFILLAVRLLLGAQSPQRWIAAGATLAAAVLLHQLAVLVAAGLSLALLLVRGENRFRNGALLFTLAWVSLTATIYIGVGFCAAGVHSPRAFVDWVLTVHTRAASAHQPFLSSCTQSVRAFTESLVSTVPFYTLRGHNAGSGGTFGPIMTFLVFVTLPLGFVWFATSSFRPLARPRNSHVPVMRGFTLGLVLLACFIFWFQAWNVDYWVYIIAAAWIVIAIHISLPGFLRRDPKRRGAILAAAMYCLLLGGINLTQRAIPQHDPASATYREAVDFATRLAGPGSLFIVGEGFHSMDALLAIPFFAHVQISLAEEDTESPSTHRLRAEARRRLVDGQPVFATAEALLILTGDPRAYERMRFIGTLREESVYALTPQLFRP